MTDLALWRLWAERRDAGAFGEIVARYAAMVYSTCTRILHNPADAEDVTQECFEVLAGVGRGPNEHLGAWLHRVATNRALDRIRAEQRRRAREVRFAAEQTLQVEPAWNDVYTLVDEAVAELPDDLRIPVVAHFLLGESHAEIARAIDVPRRSVSRRISRGVELVGESLKKRGVRIGAVALGTLMTANLANASTVPGPLLADLGRLALAQSANGAGAAGATGAVAIKIAGGVLIMKKVAVIAVVAVGALLAVWSLKTQSGSGNVESHEAPASVAQEDVSAASPAAPDRVPGSTGVPAAAVTSAAASGETSPPGIRGRVVDAETGEGIAGAKVVATENHPEADAGGHKAEAVSGADGRFEITGLYAGGYLILKEEGPGDYMASIGNEIVSVWLKEGAFKEGVVLRARKGGIVSGVVTSPGGSPVANASVTLESARNESFQGVKASLSGVRGATRTDAAGQYTLRGVKPGKDSAVRVHAEGYIPAQSPEFTLSGPGAFKRIDLQMSRGSAVTGWVEDRDGKRLPGVEVTVEPEFEGRSHLETVLTMLFCRTITGCKSDENGEYRIPGLPAGEYHLFAGGIRRSPYGHLGGGTDVKLDGLHDVEGIALRNGSVGRGDHSIAGHVINAEGTPVSGARVDYLQETPPQDNCFVHTDEKGSFLLDGLPSGKAHLAVTAAGYAQKMLSPVTLDEPDLIITITRNVAVRGRVLDRDGGQPLRGVAVTVFQNEERLRATLAIGPFSYRLDGIREEVVGKEKAVSDGDGRFEFAGIEPGRVRLKAERAGYAASSADLVVEPARPVEDVSIRMARGARVGGTVQGRDGAPVGGASILVIESAPKGEAQGDAEGRLIEATNMGEGSPKVRAITDEAGFFAVGGLADGVYWLRAMAAGFACSTVATVSVSGGTTQSGIELVLDPGGTVEGLVTQGGIPKPDVIMQANCEGANGELFRVYTNAEGRYKFEHLMSGTHDISAWDSNSRRGNAGVIASQVTVVTGKSIRKDFAYRGHSVKGVVSGLANPEAWQVCVFRFPGGMDLEAAPDPSVEWPFFVVGTGQVRSDGGYVVENLADGTYKIDVTKRGDVAVPTGRWKTVVVADADVDVDLQARD